MTPELQLLLLFCRARVNNREIPQAEIKQLINNGIQWPEFFRLLLFHRMLPLVYPALIQYLPEDFSKGQRSQLDHRYKKQTLNALKGTAELLRLLNLFKEHRIEPICFKGPVLALQLYNNIQERHHGDIDFLVTPEHIEAVDKLLIENGYQAFHRYQGDAFKSPRQLRAFISSNYHTHYVHHISGNRVEIHFRLFKNPHYFPISLNELFQRARTIDYQDVKVNTLHPVDDILYLFAHGANHKWYRLKWLVDIGLLLHAADTPWPDLFRQSRIMKLERPVAQGLILAHKILECPLPEGFDRTVETSKRLTRLIRESENQILNPNNNAAGNKLFPSLQKKPYLMALKPGLRYKLNYLRMFFYFDSNRDLLKLPDRWFFLYYVLNPFLWLYRKVTRMKKRHSNG